MKFLTSGLIKEFEAGALTDLSSSLALINSAANACAKELSHFGASCVFCGKGNNGADGYRLAEILRSEGKSVFTVRVAEPSSEECAVLAGRCAEAGIESLSLDEAEKRLAGFSGAVVDAIFGIGIKGEVTGPAKRAIALINASGAYVLSVDVPSGLDADGGAVCGVCVLADKTVTFTAPKTGMLSNESVDTCGEIVVADAGVPVDASRVPAELPSALTTSEAARLLPPRPRLSHKGAFGKALMIVGSSGMLGAAAIAARAAVRGGAGLVRLVCRKGLENTLNILVPEAVVLAVDSFSADDPVLAAALKTADALLIGCGLGGSVSAGFIASALDLCPSPAVIDADGLRTVAGRPEIFRGRNAVLTPHPLEFSALCGKSVAETEADRLGAARSFAAENGVTLVLKGARTVVAEPDGEAAVSLASTSALAKAGSGDALAGLITAFCAQGLSPAAAARLGVYVHSRAGLKAGELFTDYAATVGDITDCFKYVFSEVSAYGKELGRNQS